MESTDIIKASIRQDENAFRKLVDSYSDFAFSVAFRIVNNEDESKDIVQESFISVWKKIGSFNIENNFKNWLYRILVNKCYDFLRRKKRVSFIHPDSTGWNIEGLFSEGDPEAKLNNKEIGHIIRLLTNKLSAKQKTVFILSELEGLPHDEIVSITGMVKTAVKSNLHHARRNIGRMIEKYF